MGNDVSRIRLEPAEEVEEAPYELQSIKYVTSLYNFPPVACGTYCL